MSGRFDKVMRNLEERRERAVSGMRNCIPFPFSRFRKAYPGVERGRYIICTANQKVGKSKFCDFVFVYEPLFLSVTEGCGHVKVLYFTLEMSPEEKYMEFLCHLLFRLDGIRISPVGLRSVDVSRPVDGSVLSLLSSERYRVYIDAYERMVEYVDSERNPTGINKYCWDYAMAHGTVNRTGGFRRDEMGNKVAAEVVDRDNPYTPGDPEEHVVVIVDNASNLSGESGLRKMDVIDKMSKYCIMLRNQLGYTVVLVQHQAQQQESMENLRWNRIRPTPDGLADCKTTSRDASMVIGLYNPYKYGVREYEGYDVAKMRGHARFLEVLEDRDYGLGAQICPLYFDGAVSHFTELPLPSDRAAMEAVYRRAEETDIRRSGGLMAWSWREKPHMVAGNRGIITNFIPSFRWKGGM